MHIALPPHAYVPGQSERHPDGLFDTLRCTARAGMSAEELGDCAAWRVGWIFLENGFFWEAHEVWESVWMKLPPNSAERCLTQSAIQFANALLKAKMGRPNAALRLCQAALDHLSGCDPEVRIMGVSVSGLRADIQTQREDWRESAK